MSGIDKEDGTEGTAAEPVRPHVWRQELAMQENEGESEWKVGERLEVTPPEPETKERHEMEHDEGEHEERPEKYVRAPTSPSREEFERHMVTHVPFRSWCVHCVRGRAVASPHKKAKDKEGDRLPVISLDYMFMGSKVDEGTASIIVLRDDKSGATMARVVDTKGGSDEWTLQEILDFLNFLAYSRLVIKCDQEPSTLDLRQRIKEKYAGEVACEDSPVGDSKSNGAIECAVREVQGLIRTYKDHLEHHVGEKSTRTTLYCQGWFNTPGT